MVGFLTYGNKKFYELDAKMRKLIPPMYKSMKDLVPFIDADAAAFSEYMVGRVLTLDQECCTVKQFLSDYSKRDQKLFFKTGYGLMQVKSIAECSKRAFCNIFDLH